MWLYNKAPRTQADSKVTATLRIATFVAVLAAVNGCAGRMARQDQDDDAAAKQQAAGTPQAAATQNNQTAAAGAPLAPVAPPADPRTTPLAMSARLETLEAKISQLNEKLDAERAAMDNFLTAHSPKAAGSPSQAADTVGIPVSSAPVSTDPESGFVNDASIHAYRKAEILQVSQKYADAILAFSSFLEKYPDHPLAGSAQFHIGEAYFKEKQYSQADQEFQKVLTSYDRSVHIAETLKLMAEAEEHLSKSQEAAKHREQLTSLFANSPAAQNVTSSTSSTPVSNSVVESPKEAEPAPHHAAAPTAHEAEPTNEGTTIRDSDVPSAPMTRAQKGGLDEPPPTAPVTTGAGQTGETAPSKE
jgi:TolA-binding protein